MADTTTVSKYPKAENDESDVKAVQQNRLANGAKAVCSPTTPHTGF